MRVKRFILLALFSLAISFPALAQSNTEYAKIPFEIKDNVLMVSLDFFGRGSMYNLIFDTVGSAGVVNQNGREKMEKYFGQDMRSILLEKTSAGNPKLSKEEINSYVEAMLDARYHIFSFKRIKITEGYIYNIKFYLSPDSYPEYSDGFVGLTAFEGVKSLTINFRENIIEVKAPLKKKKNGIPLHRADLGLAYSYYIMGELDGVEQPFMLNLGNNINTVRENTKSSKVYEGGELMEILKSSAPVPSESGTTHVSKLKLKGVSGKIDVVKYDDDSLRNNDYMRRISSVFNTLGYSLFKDKCVQLDFENMMLYVW